MNTTENHKPDPSSNVAMDGNENHTLLVARSNSTFVAKIGSSMLVVNEMTQSRILRVASKVSLTKPMYRDDIFYSGSLLRLPQYANNVSNTYIMDVACKYVH